MTTFDEYHGVVCADKPLQYARYPYLTGFLRKKTKVESLEFCAAVASMANLTTKYDQAPLTFMETMTSMIDPRVSRLNFYQDYLPIIFSLHIHDFFSVHSRERRIPHKHDLSLPGLIKRLEYKTMLATLILNKHLLHDTYEKIAEDTPELFCDHDLDYFRHIPPRPPTNPLHKQTSLLPADKPTTYRQHGIKVGWIPEPSQFHTDHFKDAVSSLSILEYEYTKPPTMFFNIVRNTIQQSENKDYYMTHCKPIVSAHCFNYLVLQSWMSKIPARQMKQDITSELKRLEYKMIMARFHEEGLLSTCTYHFLTEHTPELYCSHFYEDTNSSCSSDCSCFEHNPTTAQDDTASNEQSANDD